MSHVAFEFLNDSFLLDEIQIESRYLRHHRR